MNLFWLPFLAACSLLALRGTACAADGALTDSRETAKRLVKSTDGLAPGALVSVLTERFPGSQDRKVIRSTVCTVNLSHGSVKLSEIFIDTRSGDVLLLSSKLGIDALKLLQKDEFPIPVKYDFGVGIIGGKQVVIPNPESGNAIKLEAPPAIHVFGNYIQHILPEYNFSVMFRLLESSQPDLARLPTISLTKLLGNHEQELSWTDGEFESFARISKDGAITFWKLNKLGVTIDLRSTRIVEESDWPKFAINSAEDQTVSLKSVFKNIGRPSYGIIMLPAENRKNGIEIAFVSDDSDAYRKEVRKGDRILFIDGSKANDVHAVAEMLRARKSTTLKLQRADGSVEEIEIERSDARGGE